jgi:N-acetylglucosamine-6-phosphate deacetylase
MTQLFLQNARVVLASQIVRGGVLIRDDRIESVIGIDDAPVGLGADERLDLEGLYLAPGLIDIHIHGAAGVDVQATDEAGLAKLSEFLLSQGTTGYFATFVPTDEQSYRAALETISCYLEQESAPGRLGAAKSRAKILGVHFEGPFVSHNRCGALKREFFRSYDGDPASVELFVRGVTGADGAGAGRLMTLAPEIKGGIELARHLTRKGVRVFIGHSQAQPAVLDEAAEAGARHITHFPNALDPLHHRKPGAVGWGLLRQDVTLDCIADFHHVDPLMLQLIYKVKGPENVALISDAIQPAGLGDGEFEVWGERISVRGGRTSLESSAEGTIAGSVITMMGAFRNVVRLGTGIAEASRMSSAVPARVSGVALACGSISAGRVADLIAFDDELALKLMVLDGVPGRR